LAAAEPFDDDDPIWSFDGEEPDDARWAASTARQLLEQDEREKAALGYPLEPESTPQSERRKRLEESERQKTEEEGKAKPSTLGKGK